VVTKGRPDARWPGELVGRAAELGLVGALLQESSQGHSRVLVIRGEPGIGKTVLLEHAIGAASGFRVVRATGVESEMELPFAALHQLCAPLLDHMGRLPGPQMEALATAFGLAAGPSPDRFLISLASLSLLTEASEDTPILCVIDDAQWLDNASAQTLAFIARRLLADRVCLLFGTRELTQDLKGLPELTLEGLDDASAQALLASVVHVPVDDGVRDRIVAETRGNPLAIVEWTRGLSASELGGGFATPALVSIERHAEESFRSRLDELSPSARMFLTIAAAEPSGDAALVWRAAAELRITGEDADPAVDVGLVEVGTRVLFRHPAARSVAYTAAATGERRDAHRALAEATNAAADPDRRAWHLALAASGPDEDVAKELQRAAGRARARGGMAASAAMLERSAALTIDPAQRLHRTILAAQAHLEAGAPDASMSLLTAVEAGPLDDVSRARVELLRGGFAMMWGDNGDAAALLSRAARRLERIDAGSARRIYIDALSAAVSASNYAPADADVETVAAAAIAAPSATGPERPQNYLLEGLARVVVYGTAAAAPVLRRALELFRETKLGDEEGLWFGYQCAAASVLWDHEQFEELGRNLVQSARDVGALRLLPMALDTAALPYIFGGDLSTAELLIGEAELFVEATRSEFAVYAGAMIAAWRGNDPEAEQLIGATIAQARTRGQGMAVKVMQSALATLYNGLGRYDDALAAAQQAAEPPSWWAFQLTLHELIEAACRTGQPEIAAAALERLTATTQPIGTPWAIGVTTRARALVNAGDAAEALFLESIEQLERSPVRPELARSHLAYGEWLRRENRRSDARRHLRRAYEQFSQMRMDAFAERARRELRATGETVRKRKVETHAELTPQELQVAMLARDGLSNREIGGRLFISAHTVQYHLSKVFTKVGISSRAQLSVALVSGSPEQTELR
jgi:DNA-binding CsgD family transcriptional regulator